MVKDACLNGTMANSNNYSSPVPLVGVYIAAASMVCFLLVLCDVLAGFRDKRYWFPCRFFSLNSVTLTLISVAAKIPVDLTTTMPGKQDQLSKLFGTVFICVTMCFMLPSLAKNAEFESYANVTALSIFVITVVVNICIQMATGVIYSFIVEHAVILFFMWLILMRFWLSVTAINVYKHEYTDASKGLIRNGQGNMVARLKNCYLYAYHSCPQLYACRHPFVGDVGTICMICLIVLVQATVRSFLSKNLKFSEGRSDYGWSMWLVVASQSLTLAVVIFAVGGRWFFSIAHIRVNHRPPGLEEPYLQFQYLFSLVKVPSFVVKTFKFVIYLPLFYINFVWLLLDFIVHLLLSLACRSLCGVYEDRDILDANRQEFESLVRRHYESFIVDNWALQKGVADMKRWMKMDELEPLKHLHNLLSSAVPSQEISYSVGPKGEGVKISLLSMVSLVGIAKLVIPRGKVSLTNVLDEVFEINHFIENKVNTGGSNERLRTMLAKVVHQYGLRSGLTEYRYERSDVKFDVVEKRRFCYVSAKDPVGDCIRDATRQVSNFIGYRSGESSEAAYDRICRLFVDMLYAFLAQLPVAVYTHILESPAEEQQERVRRGLGYICKLQSFESHIRFSLPSGSNITSLFETETPAITTQAARTQVQGVSTLSPNITPAVEVFCEIQEDAQATGDEV